MPNGFLSTQGEPPNSLYYARFHPHLHAIVADGLFRINGTFYVFPKCEMKQLEEIFRSRILAMLKCVVLGGVPFQSKSQKAISCQPISFFRLRNLSIMPSA